MLVMKPLKCYDKFTEWDIIVTGTNEAIHVFTTLITCLHITNHFCLIGIEE